MLKMMREGFKHLKWILWFTILIFVAFVFVDWGMGRVRGEKMDPGTVASVGGDRLATVDFSRELQQQQDRYRQMYKDRWTPAMQKALDLPDQVLSGMIQRRLMLTLALRNGVRISDRELAEKIQSDPNFQQNGKFIGAENYTNLLSANGFTPDQFEQSYRQDLMIQKFENLVCAGILVPDGAVRRMFEQQNDRARIDYLLIPQTQLATVAAPTDAELLTFFNQNKERFRQPERRKLKYLLVQQDRLRQELKPSLAEITAYYNAHQQEFAAPERVHAAHILIKLPANATAAEDAAARKKALAVLARAKAGDDFAGLAREYSDDPGSKASGGDLGVFGRGQMIKPFEDAAFGMTPGEVTGPVKTQFGYHIIKLIEKIPAGEQTLAEATPRIVTELTQATVPAAENRRVETMEKKISASSNDADLRKLTDDVVSFNATDWVTENGTVPGLSDAGTFLKTAFALKKGEVTTTPVGTSRGAAFIKVEDIRAPGIPDFGEVKEQVAQGYMREKTAEQTQAAAAPLAQALKSGATLADIAKKYNVTVQTPAEFSRGGAISGLGRTQALMEAIFAAAPGTTGGPVVISGRGAVLFKVDSRTEAPAALYDAQKEKIRLTLAQQEGQRLIQAELQRMQGAEKIEVNTELMKRFETQGS